ATERRPNFVTKWTDLTARRDFTALDKFVYLYLHDRQGEHEPAWPSLETMAAELGASKQCVHESLLWLEAKGLVTVERGRPNRYTVQPTTGADAQPSTSRAAFFAARNAELKVKRAE